MNSLRGCIFSVCLMLISYCGFAQRVGLVLSGGGAKGLYHIGIIKALEENSIPIDYVSGTSMGSIVAGMYASGYSADEMEAIFKSEEVKYWLTGKIEDKYKYYFKEPEPTPALLNMDIDLVGLLRKRKSHTVSNTSTNNVFDITNPDTVSFKKEKKPRNVSFSVVPNGIEVDERSKERNNERAASMYPSMQMDIAFLYFFASSSSYCNNNFDSLFVPFRCVSVDIMKKRQYLWSKGDLGMAIRSSMAIPVVFKPVKVDSMLMYDGGLQNNFPWQEMVDDFDPDVIIGGKCVGGVPDVSSITGQIEMLVMNQTNYDLPPEKGVMIERNVDVGMLDFGSAEEVIRQGYLDAMRMMPQLKARIDRRVSPEDIYLKRLAFKESLPELQFNDFDINGLTDRQSEYVESQLGITHTKDSTSISFEEFKKDYLKILSEGSLDGDFPIAKYDDKKGLFDLDVEMYAKPSFKALLGLNISSTSVNQVYLGLHYRNISRITSKYMIDGNIGSFYSSFKLGARYNFYGGRTPFYIEPDFCYNFFDYARGNSQRISLKSSDLGYSRYNDLYVSAIVGTPIKRLSKFEFRFAGGHDKYSYIRVPQLQNSDNPDRSKIGFFTINLSISRNSLNYVMYPTRGIEQRIAVFGITSREKFTGTPLSSMEMSEGKFRNSSVGASFLRTRYFYFAKYFSLGYLINAVYSTNIEQSNGYMNVMMSPEFTPTPHSKTLYIPEFRNSSFIALGLMPIFEINEKLYLKTEGYCFKPDLTNYKDVKDRLRYILSMSAVFQSPVGAISFNYSRYFNVNTVKANYFTLNIGLLMFNKKGIVY